MTGRFDPERHHEGSFDVATNIDRWVEHTGRNVARIVIGSYFVAVSTGLVQGVDTGALFAPYLPTDLAEQAGAALLMAAAIVFMSGLVLRLSALMLALFVLFSSLAQNQFLFGAQGVSAYWRDVALVCAVLLSYSAHRSRGMRGARRLPGPGNGFWGRRGTRMGVTPRRITVSASSARHADRPDHDSMLRPVIAPTGPIPRRQKAPDGSASAPGHTARPTDAAPGDTAKAPQGLALLPAPDDDECENIFANI